jgi:NO-binding membrane sensor protein with MHYT domain
MLDNGTAEGIIAIQEQAGKIIPKGLIPGYVVLSFFISYLGSWTTLELINRRTSSKGLYNWYLKVGFVNCNYLTVYRSLLIGAAMAMGGIGIWCMHFIGNRAIVLGDGSPALQISYSPGFTALSFFVPIIVLFMAFTAMGTNEELDLIRLGFGGTLAGLGACGMHYLGQAGIANYNCSYYVAFIVGAAILAVVAATAALGVFFVFRSQWTAVWWKRGICALILAGAVSGMHWLASTGTQYRLKKDAAFTPNNSRQATTISVIILVSSVYS